MVHEISSILYQHPPSPVVFGHLLTSKRLFINTSNGGSWCTNKVMTDSHLGPPAGDPRRSEPDGVGSLHAKSAPVVPDDWRVQSYPRHDWSPEGGNWIDWSSLSASAVQPDVSRSKKTGRTSPPYSSCPLCHASASWAVEKTVDHGVTVR